ncbi:DNA translocase FtsK, partial [Streptococcus sobrinus]
DVMQERPILAGTFRLVTADLKNVDVTHFLGGGMIGAVIYQPVVFLFSNIGSYLVGGLFIILGLYLMSSWDVYDVMNFFKKTGSNLSDKIDQTSLQMESRREEKRKAKAEARAQAQATKDQEAEQAEEANDFSGLIDPETGEILSASPAQTTPKSEPEILGGYDEEEAQDGYSQQDFKNYHFHYPDEEATETPEPEPAPTAASSLAPDQEEDDEPVQVDFTPKQHLLYKLPTIDLFAPDKPKNQTKEKKIVRKNIKILEETFASFGIKAAVERAEIGPSVTKYEIKPAVGVRVNRISNLADDLALALAAKDVRIEAPIPGKSLVGIEVPNS